MIQPVPSVLPRPRTEATPQVQASRAQASAVCTFAISFLLLGLVYFGVQTIMNPALWAASLWLLVPEVVLIGVTLTAAAMGLIGLPRLGQELLSGTVRGETRARQENWLMLAFFAAGTQIAWALMVSGLVCG